MFFDSETMSKLRGNDKKARCAMAIQLAHAYHQNFFTRQEQQLADEILRLLVQDKDPELRRQLVEILKTNLLLPQDIVINLAQDVDDEVACPMLQYSYLLSEAELEQLVKNNIDLPRLQAIARREALSSRLSTALINRRLPQLMLTLLSNSGAQLDEDVVSSYMLDSQPDEEIMDLLLKRSEFSYHLQDELRDYAASRGMDRLAAANSNIAPDQVLEAARIYSLLGMTLEQVKGDGLAHLVHQLHQEGRLSISLLLRALCIGEVNLVEHGLARSAKVPVENARILLKDRGGRGINALYNAATLPEIYRGVFIALFSLLTNDTTLKTLHPLLLKHHLMIAIQDEEPQAVEFAAAIIRQATDDLANAEDQFSIQPPLADALV